MIDINSDNTKQLNIKDEHYCYYCGKKMNCKRGYEDRDYYEDYTCDCENAIKEQKVKKEIQNFKQNIIDLEYFLNQIKSCSKQIKYKVELEVLKKKYDIEED